MTDLEPLLQTSSDETELALLRSLERDEPSTAAMARTAVALGLGTGALTAAGSASAAGAASGLAKGSLWGPVLKALAIGVGSGLVVSAAAPRVFSEPERELAPPAQAPLVAAPSPLAKAQQPVARDESVPAPSHAGEASGPITPRSGPSVAAKEIESPAGFPPPAPQRETPAGRAAFAPVLAPAPSFSANTAVPSLPAAPITSQAPKIAKAAPAISIAEEVKTMDRARQALSSGRAREALSELEHYQLQWPRGVFTSEVLVLRVEAKLKLGDRASAVREASALIAAQPNSRHAARLRALIENSK